MQSIANTHAKALSAHLDLTRVKFIASIWTKKDGILHEVELRMRLGFKAEGTGERQYVHVRSKAVLESTAPVFECCPDDCPLDVSAGFHFMKEQFGTREILISSIIVKTIGDAGYRDPSDLEWRQERAQGTDSELYRLTQLAFSEAFDTDVTPLKSDPYQFRGEELKRSVLLLGEAGMRQLLERPFEELKPLNFMDIPLCDMNLSGASLRGLNLKNCNFARACLDNVNFEHADLTGSSFINASLQKARLSFATAKGANFTGANLNNAKMESMQLANAIFVSANLHNALLSDAKAEGANFTGATMDSATLDYANLKKTVFRDVDLSKVSLSKSDLRSADLSMISKTEHLNPSSFFNAKYDELTKLPSDSLRILKQLTWKGNGENHHLEGHKKQFCESDPVDFSGFIGHLNGNFDKDRLKKALGMLKKETFQLFSEVTESNVTGIVKSQTDADLVYSCRLAADGTFSCCTQNLKACGGLRGYLCKHILVLIIGLTQAEQMQPTTAARWVLASTVEKPKLDKDAMTDVFLRYEGAKSGEIDWRPTETIPEDFYAF